MLDSFPANKEITSFPDRYSITKKVPALPAGSGKWQDFEPPVKDKKNKKRKEKRS